MDSDRKLHLFETIAFDCERDIITSTWVDDNSDEAEALNERAIMAQEKSMALFTDAIEKGNIHAMFNGYVRLYGTQRYKEAGLWLVSMNSRPAKNIKCLWNEAMFRYYGKDIPNNPLKGSKRRSAELLHYIVGHYYDFIEKYGKIVQEAYIFILKHNLGKISNHALCSYELWKSVELEHPINYAAIGHNLYHRLNGYQNIPWDIKYFVNSDDLQEYVFGSLDELYLDGDWRLYFIFSRHIQGFQVQKGKKLKPLCMKLRGSICKRAAWQAYLLYSAYRIMPLFDHDNYDACRPIFTTRDLDLNSFATFIPDSHFDKEIADIQKLELTEKDVNPTVRQLSDTKFEIDCIWWNDWKGLFREHALVEFNPKTNTPIMTILSTQTIYHYECPIDL